MLNKYSFSWDIVLAGQPQVVFVASDITELNFYPDGYNKPSLEDYK